jgi:hypothetical protein
MAIRQVVGEFASVRMELAIKFWEKAEGARLRVKEATRRLVFIWVGKLKNLLPA